MIGKLMKRVNRVDSAALLTLFIAVLLFFSDLFTGRYLLTERDLSPYSIPPQFFWVESIKRGDFPLWNPYQFCGQPFFANPQYAILYPLNVLSFILPFDIAFNSIILLHFFLGGLFTYILLRDLAADAGAALIAGIIFMLSGYLISIHSLLPTLHTVVWTPLIIFFFRRALIVPGITNEIMTALFFTISFLGGGLDNVYGNVFILLIMVIFYRETPFSFKKRMGSMLLVLVLFALLSAVQLIPFLELFYHSNRGTGLSFAEATTWSFAPWDAVLFFLTDAYGYFIDKGKYWANQCWIKFLYTGSLPFILSAVFFVKGKNRKFYAALLCVSLFLALGRYNPLYRALFDYVPTFSGRRYPVKFLYIGILAIAITAGMGFQKLKEYVREARGKNVAARFLALSLTAGLMLLMLVVWHDTFEGILKLWGFDSPAFNYAFVNLYHAQRFLFYSTLFFLLLRIGSGTRWKPWAQALLVFFLIADLLGNQENYDKQKTADYFRKTGIDELLLADKSSFRTFTTGKTVYDDSAVLLPLSAAKADVYKEKHAPTYNLLYRLHDMWGLDVLRLQRSEDLFTLLTRSPSISATNLIDLYGVKYVTSVPPIEGDPRFELIYANIEGMQADREQLIKKNTVKLYRHRNPFPRAWLVKDYKVYDTGKILAALIAKNFHPGQTVFLEEQPSWDRVSPDKQVPGGTRQAKVALLSESNNQVRFQVSAPVDSLLVVSDTYYPGWKAAVYPVLNNLVDEKHGKQKKILCADYAFRALALEAGEYEVQFTYEPVSFKVGMAVSILTALGIVGLYFKNKRALKAGQGGSRI
jgi:hypothetical protein